MLVQIFDVLKAFAVVIGYFNAWRQFQIQTDHRNIISETNSFDQPFDFIIVGAGSAGSVLAARLSENAQTRVLLLEAGGPQNPVTDIPGLTLISPVSNWNYYVNGLGRAFINNNGGRGYLPRGKVMGGSSSINMMVYLRGSPQVYDQWASSSGLKNWSWKHVFPYFLKSERNLDRDNYDNGYHAFDGPFVVSSAGKDFTPAQLFLNATRELGFDTIDFNGPRQVGCNVVQRNIDENGVRVSAARAYLEPVASRRPNLIIKSDAFVTKILFQNKRAVGVEFNIRGQVYKAQARIEVIVSAGAVNTPQLLMLSGVGPVDQLTKHRIKVVADLPGVGANVHDHAVVALPNLSANQYDPLSIAAMPLITAYSFGSVFTVCQANSSINTDQNYPDIQLANVFVPAIDPANYIFNALFNLEFKASDKYYGPYVYKPIFFTLCWLQRPKSRGFIYLQSADPYQHPIIQPNYLQHPDDVKMTIDNIKLAYRIGKTKTFKQADVEPFKTTVLGCEHLVNRTYENHFGWPTDAYLECALRRHTHTGYHIVGSCKMGNDGDQMAVVNSELRVRKVTGLRVVDASVIPVIPNVNTAPAVVMIAERAADFIKRQYGL